MAENQPVRKKKGANRLGDENLSVDIAIHQLAYNLICYRLTVSDSQA